MRKSRGMYDSRPRVAATSVARSDQNTRDSDTVDARVTVNEAAIESLDSSKEELTSKGVASGYAGLGSDGLVPSANLPASSSSGAQGPRGAPGPEGDDGEHGPPGQTGSTGASGAAGSTGSQGPTGPAVFMDAEPGQDGDPGAPGTRGSDGATGSTGAQGQTGPAVFLDAEAIEGEPGVPGTRGTDGAAGTTGSAGPIGPAVYLTAEPGEDGAPPIPGPQGATGPSGTTGAQGPIGPAVFLESEAPESPLDAVPGPQGLQGVTGAQGPSGPPIFFVSDMGDAGEPQSAIPAPLDHQNPVGSVTTPAVPASTTAILNTTGRSVTVYIKAGTLTVVTVGGVATGIAAAAPASTCHVIPLAINQTIAITYSVAPTWTWVGGQN